MSAYYSEELFFFLIYVHKPIYPHLRWKLFILKSSSHPSASASQVAGTSKVYHSKFGACFNQPPNSWHSPGSPFWFHVFHIRTSYSCLHLPSAQIRCASPCLVYMVPRLKARPSYTLGQHPTKGAISLTLIFQVSMPQIGWPSGPELYDCSD